MNRNARRATICGPPPKSPDAANDSDEDERLVAAEMRRFRRRREQKFGGGSNAHTGTSSTSDTETASEGEMEVYPEGSEYAGGDVLVSLSDLREIKDLFDEYEEQGGMEIDDFIEKFGAIVRKRNQGITDTDLALMFMRVDANANRSVDWGEISTYLLMSTEKDAIRQTAKDNARTFTRQPIEQEAIAVPEVKLLSHEGPVRRTLVPRGGAYITADDFTVKLWQPGTLRHIRTPHFSRAAITDVQMTPQWHGTVGVACMDSTLTFYNAQNGDMHHAFVGQRRSLFVDEKGRPNRNRMHGAGMLQYRSITRPVYTVGLNRVDEKRLHFGDKHSVAGNVDTSVPLLKHFVKDQDIPATVLYDLGFDMRNETFTGPVWRGFPTAFDIAQRNSLGGSPVLFAGLRSGSIQAYSLGPLQSDDHGIPPIGLECTGYYDAHTDWISKLRYFPNLDAVVTSSWDGTLQVRHLDRLDDPGTVLGTRITGAPPMEGSSWNALASGHARRVTTFDYHESLKLLASCAAAERDVLVWSPYLTRPLGRLDSAKGHLLDLHFCQDDVHLVTLSDDMVIRLWDLRSYRCVTTLNVKKQAQQTLLHKRRRHPILLCVVR
jgi:WD40 repeat protein